MILHEAPSLKPLLGRRALITGAGTGIGRGIALSCARAGADIALHYHDEEDSAAATIAEIRAMGRTATPIRGDFRRAGEAERVGARALEALGGIDLLVNNAGITATRPLAEVDAAMFTGLMAVNVGAMLFLTQRLAPAMAAQGHGVVINLASLHAYFGRREHSVYAATKGAVVALTTQLAVELGPLGIRVNAIAPGTCVTETQRASAPRHDFAAEGKRMPCGYFSEPRHVGELVVFLASPAADHFTGQTLRFDGGFSALFPNVADFAAPLGRAASGGTASSPAPCTNR
jgi:NAD(P)-dependent dehydrogenase (short-subunit alcohol dehydrogenase family)